MFQANKILNRFSVLVLWGAMLVMGACSSVKHVPEGSYLLESVDIDVVGDDDVSSTELSYFLRQKPNHKVLGFAKLSLGAYSLSGRDSTKWYNRWLRRAGQPPVIFDADLAEASRNQLLQAVINRGYMDATVSLDSFPQPERRRMGLKYTVTTGEPHRVSTIDYNVADTAMAAIIEHTRNQSLLHQGMLFDRNVLDNERTRIARLFQNKGFYRFNRDYINFTADTVAGSKNLGLTVNVHQPSAVRHSTPVSGLDSILLADGLHHTYIVRSVTFFVDADRNVPSTQLDTVTHGAVSVVYGRDHYLRAGLLDEMCYLVPGAPYSTRAVERTYESLGRLSIIKFVNIETAVAGTLANTGLLDIYITVSRNTKQAISAELEGTNSEGDLGFGVGVTYQHRNLAKGSETLTAKLRASYESLSGNFDGLVNKRYNEYAAEVGINFPKFECPFLTKSFKQRVLASTEFAVSFNWQARPEYTRVIAGAVWRWKWSHQRQDFLKRQTFDLLDINYVRLPKSTINFIDQIALTNPLLRYSYEDHFIMRMGYTYSITNRTIPLAGSLTPEAVQPSVYSLRLAAESAGNLLYGISSAIHQRRSDGVYKILGIQYAQYVKGEADYTYTRNLNTRNALSFHAGVGIAVPYGNSSMVPFEKRFYAGGANGVRGWGVRTLGPGSYDAKNSVTDFINQCGDIRLDLSVEYRTKLFWVLEGALFVDAGNIWTIRDYPNQPGGLFKFDSFYKEIAAAYGLGIRFDFTYFLLRLDLGFKAHNPAMNQEQWPIIHPKWSRDANFHFAVGYPF